MKLLNDIPTKFFVGIDVETVRIAETYDELSDAWKSAWEYKNKQDGVIPTNEELAASWVKTSALYAEFAKVCAVSITFLNDTGTKLYVKEFFGENEEEILSELSAYLNRMSAKSKEFRLVAHAGKYFDYPFLSKRYVILGLDIPTILDTAHLKPWDNKNICTNADVWKMGGTGAGSSLQALCTALGIPVSKVDLVGDEVGAAFYKGEYARIGRYCSYDTVAVFNIIRRIKKEGVFGFEDVEYLEKKALPEQVPVLQRIYMSNLLTDEVKNEIKALVIKAELDSNEKENLKDIILAHYIAKGDRVGVKKEKTAQVNEYIDSL